jgi:hypothetical protein
MISSKQKAVVHVLTVIKLKISFTSLCFIESVITIIVVVSVTDNKHKHTQIKLNTKIMGDEKTRNLKLKYLNNM